ncbi:hypothetical protein M5D96_007253 [Drosophila gunungcola]|uniref:Uncharacterized protein n=1 Tax=Drosophila gunungcola TaxID=103775 RepID=A0A9Q0BQ95_9MUSC|nr:hypothetical protein M5D96_007253 [Drosophila gunungcola]
MDFFLFYVGLFFIFFLIMPMVYFALQFILWVCLNKCCGGDTRGFQDPVRRRRRRQRQRERRMVGIDVETPDLSCLVAVRRVVLSFYLTMHGSEPTMDWGSSIGLHVAIYMALVFLFFCLIPLACYYIRVESQTLAKICQPRCRRQQSRGNGNRIRNRTRTRNRSRNRSRNRQRYDIGIGNVCQKWAGIEVA